MRKILVFAVFIVLSALLVTSCSDSPTGTDGRGRIRLYMVDAPASIDSVIIDVLRVEVHSSSTGWSVVNDTPAVYDLLSLTNGASVVLGDDFLMAGHYTQIRLILGNDNYIYVNGTRYDLVVPSGEQTGIKLNHEFDIEPDNLYELYLDFNADKSVHQTGSGKYMLKPVIRVEAVITSGTISGQVLPPDADPLVWTLVDQDTVSTYPDSAGYFKLMALPEGTYTVHIDPQDTAYAPKTIPDVVVIRQQNTDLGVINL